MNNDRMIAATSGNALRLLLAGWRGAQQWRTSPHGQTLFSAVFWDYFSIDYYDIFKDVRDVLGG